MKKKMMKYKYFGTGRKRVLGQLVQNPGDIVEIPAELNFRHQLFVPLTDKKRNVRKRKF